MTRADHFYGASDMGRQRSNNEDAFVAASLPDGKLLACVIDGVGGYEGGEVAAAIAKETIEQNFKQPAADIILKMKSCFVQANEKIYEDRLKNPERDNMACVLTLSVVDPENNQFYYAHVGDTRLYLFRDNSLIKVTKDHSFVGFLEDNRRISEEEAMSHPKRNEVNKALGYDPNMAGVADYIETGASPFLPGDLLMLCSDGLTDLVDNKTMSAILESSASLADRAKLLINAANEAGGKDNITVVLVHHHKKAAKQKATKPVAIKKNEEPASQAEKKITSVSKPPGKKGNPLAVILFILLLAASATAWYFWNETKKEKPQTPQNISPALSASHQRLLDSLEVSPFVFMDSSYGTKIMISDTISVLKDSLYLNGSGIVFSADTNYKGPLLFASNECKYILLENLVIENFDIGLIANSRILRFKNVIFRNCRIPVQYNFTLPLNRAITGVVIDTLLFKPDSLSKGR